MALLKMTDLALRGQRVMIREDFNVPLAEGQITSSARLQAALPTIRHALEKGAKILLLSHLGRPTEGQWQAEFSLAPVAHQLENLLQHPVRLVRDWLDGVPFTADEIILCENVRFNPGEKADDDALARRMAALCDIFVMDAFATAHRAEASTHGIAKYAPVACAGPLLLAELEALSRALHEPARPLVIIAGGSKVSTKLELLQRLFTLADRLIVGGGIANTFLAARGLPIGASLHEAELVPQAQRLWELAQQEQCEIGLPEDVVVADRFAADAKSRICPISAVVPADTILDIGPASAAKYAQWLAEAKTIIWNGPVGVFEFDAFANGTRILANAIAESAAFSLAGGGDTIAAIEKFTLTDKISYISTGGGAFLAFLEGKTLPAVAILQTRAAQHA